MKYDVEEKPDDISEKGLRFGKLTYIAVNWHGWTQDCFAYRVSMVWNSLFSECKTGNTFQSFTLKLKTILAEYQ